jgi:hypothetical protein
MRPHLHAVNFRRSGASIDMAATDGTRLALYRFLASTFEVTGDGNSVTVPLHSIKAFLRVIGPALRPKLSRSRLRRVTAIVNGAPPPSVIVDADACELSADVYTVRYDRKAADVSFPVYETVIPTALTAITDPVAPRLLASSLAAFDSLADVRLGVSVHLAGSGSLNALVLTSSAVRELLVLVMPVRGDVLSVPPKAILEDTTRLPFDMRPHASKLEPAAQ